VKKLQFFVLAPIFLAMGCKKSVEPIENSLIGKWTYIEYYMSPGGPGEWRPVSPPKQTIEFKADGTFVPSESFLKEANHFEIVDSVTLKIEPVAPLGHMLMRYEIKTLRRELYLYPVNPMCIEGCSYKFER
jgi:hypothetical protein